MKVLTIGLLTVLVGTGSAMASTPPNSSALIPVAGQNTTLSIEAVSQALNAQPNAQSGTAVASMATSCRDPQPWYMFSGIEALTCIYTHQWPVRD